MLNTRLRNCKIILAFVKKEIKDNSVEKVFFEILQNSRPATLLKKKLWHSCFPVKFAKFLRTHCFTEHLQWLLLIQRERERERQRQRETERVRGRKIEKDRERPRGKCLESSWSVFNSIFMNNKGSSHTLKFFITFAKTFILQITWNTIPDHWHVSPAVNYGKLLVLFFF